MKFFLNYYYYYYYYYFWLLKQCHRIWSAVRITGSWKRLFLAIDPPSAERGILLSFLLFYSLVVGKHALIYAREIQKIVGPYLLRICLIYGTNASVSRGSSRISLSRLLTSNKVSLPCERLLWTGYASWGSLRKKP